MDVPAGEMGKWPRSELVSGTDAGKPRARALHKALGREAAQITMGIRDRFCSQKPGSGRWSEGGG